MPAFIKTPADENRWAKAKEAANKSHSESEGDSYWAIVNSIYQKMNKAVDLALEIGDKESLSKAIDMLVKADEMSDDNDDTGEGYSEFDPDEQEQGDVDEYNEGEDEDAHQTQDEDVDGQDGNPNIPEQDTGEDENQAPQQESPTTPKFTEEELAGMPPAIRNIYLKGMSSQQSQAKAQATAAKPTEEKVKSSQFKQPTPEEIRDMRAYTRKADQRAREATAIRADPSKNPVLHHKGKLIAAREEAHKPRSDAYELHSNSPEYKAANPAQRMRMDQKFENNWQAQNPGHLNEAFDRHFAGHKEGEKAKDIHAAAKDADIRHALRGGVSAPGEMSTEAALQGVGGIQGDTGTVGGISGDPTAAFANTSDPKFLEQYMKDYDKKAKHVAAPEDMKEFDEPTKQDIDRILGPAATQDPKFNKFLTHYYPLISMNAHNTLKSMGLDKNPDFNAADLAHEAGLHGMIRAINEYDHSHPSKASFKTYASSKISGLMKQALGDMQKVPKELRQKRQEWEKAKALPVKRMTGAEYAAQQAGGTKIPPARPPAPTAPKPVVEAAVVPTIRPTKDVLASHPKAQEIKQRLGSNNAARASAVVRRRPSGGQGNE